MNGVEQLLRQALHQADAYAPSPDLFARVQRSIEEDLAHRRRVRWVVGVSVAGLVVVGVYLAVTAEMVDGRPWWPWWSLEVLTTAVLAVLVVVLGPLIRRFGTIYAPAVFHAHPPLARRFLALLDIAYYLVFSSYVLLTVTVDPPAAWLVGPGHPIMDSDLTRVVPLGLVEQLEHISLRVGSMLLLMGIMHGLTIAALPALGLIFTDGWRHLPASVRAGGAGNNGRRPSDEG